MAIDICGAARILICRVRFPRVVPEPKLPWAVAGPAVVGVPATLQVTVLPEGTALPALQGVLPGLTLQEATDRLAGKLVILQTPLGRATLSGLMQVKVPL
jgi:hypothetical protein